MVEIQYTKINFRITLKVRWKEKEKKEGRNKGKEKSYSSVFHTLESSCQEMRNCHKHQYLAVYIFKTYLNTSSDFYSFFSDHPFYHTVLFLSLSGNYTVLWC